MAAIAAFSYFGQAVRGQTAQMAAQVAGEADSTAGTDAAVEAAGNALDEAEADTGLGNYTDRDIAGTGSGG